MRNTNGPLRRYGAIFTSLAILLCAAFGIGARGATRGEVPGDWAVVGSAVDKDGYFLLTPDDFVRGGAVWQRDQVDLRDGFDRTFVLSFGKDDAGADGIVFVLQQVGLDAVGGSGEGLGYGGISPSIGVELDTFQNGFDPPEDHVAVDENGSLAHGGAPAVGLPNLEDDREHLLRITWSPAATTLSVEVDGTRQILYTKNLVDDVFGGNPLVYLGFTAATGGARNPHYVRPATPPAQLSWTAPTAGGLNPPTGLSGSIVGIGPANPSRPAEVPSAPGPVIAYTVYRSSVPNVTPGPETQFVVLPPDRLTVRAPLAAGGTYFVVTAVYGTGESSPSNEVAVGGSGATLTKVKAKAAKITAKGNGFSRTVRVFLDGMAFDVPATVKKSKQVIQKGPLESGEELRTYLVSGRTITLTFVNEDETSVSITQTLR